MTSRQGSDPHHFTGHIRITPALNEVERAHLLQLADSRGTLRGTPTGRGDRDVPFARMWWEVCASGCCLSWNPDLEESQLMLPTLRFLIDHLLRPGAKAEGHALFGGFTFDHVLDGLCSAVGLSTPRPGSSRWWRTWCRSGCCLGGASTLSSSR